MPSLFSFQFQNPGGMSQDYVNHYASSGIDIIKVLDPDKAQWLWPSSVKCLARFYFNDQDNALVAQGRAGARTWFSWVKPRIQACPAIVAVETPNEYNVDDESQCSSWCDFMDEAAILVHSIGIKIVVGNFGVTHPTKAGVAAKLARGLVKADYLGLHEYKMKDRLSITMAAEAEASCRWWLFRYMRFVDELKSVGARIPPIWITEFGVDYQGNPDLDGWRATNLGYVGMFNLALSYEDYCKQFGYVTKIFPFISNAFSGQWQSFVNDGDLNNMFIAYIKKELTMTNLVIDGRLMDMAQFDSHVKSTDLTWAKYVVIHHTYKPTVEDWAKCGWECRKENMRLYYQDVRGWDSGPHLFVSVEGVGLFSPLNKPGTGVKGYNSTTIHIETVGDYSVTPPVGKTYEYMVKTAAILLRNMPVATKLVYHSGLQTDTSCPGNGIIYNWSSISKAIYAEQNRVDLSQEQPTATKIRWHTEEAYRELKRVGVPETDQGMQRLHELIKLDGGLMYRWEQEQS